MAESNHQFHVSLLLLLLLLFFFVSTARSTSSLYSQEKKPGKRPINQFVWDSCKATLYPRVCYASLHNSSTSDRLHLAADATNATLSKLLVVSAQVAAFRRSYASASSKVPVDPHTSTALQDCVESLGDAEDLTRQSAGELAALCNAHGSKVALHVGNAQTWLSAALTNEGTCTDGFSETAGGGKVGADVVAKVKLLKQYTSNALALVNRLVQP